MKVDAWRFIKASVLVSGACVRSEVEIFSSLSAQTRYFIYVIMIMLKVLKMATGEGSRLKRKSLRDCLEKLQEPIPRLNLGTPKLSLALNKPLRHAFHFEKLSEKPKFS